jgi:hypothetical protein
VEGQKALGRSRTLETLHLAFSSSGWLMRVLREAGTLTTQNRWLLRRVIAAGPMMRSCEGGALD